MDQHIKQDDNRQFIGSAITNDSNNDIVPLLVNPVTDELICEVIAITYDKIAYPKIKQDDNRQTVMMGVDNTNIIIPLVIDSATNALLIEIT